MGNGGFLFMSTSKKIALYSMLMIMISTIQIHSDGNTQTKIREIVKKHQSKAQVIKSKEELQKFLETIKKEFKDALKDAPNTQQYKDLKKSVDLLNPKEITTNLDHFKTILKNVAQDIKEAILAFMPFQFRAFLMI